MKWKQDNDHFTNIQKFISSKNEMLHNFFVDTYSAEKSVEKGKTYIL